MSAVRGSIRSGARYAALIALGLALGYGWIRLHANPQQGAQPTVAIPWLNNAVNAARQMATGAAPVAALPPLALRGTLVVPGDPARSTAIFDLGKGRVYVLHTGDSLPGVGVLLEIADKGVHLDVNGRRLQFTFNDSTLPVEVHTSVRSLEQAISSSGVAGIEIQGGSYQASKKFVVPADTPQFSDAPPDEPELNASPKPGQTIDTTVWN